MAENVKQFKPLDPLLHSELRLAVMSILVGVEDADFVYIKAQTGSTSGNLSVQIDKLSSAGYIEVEKTFKGKKPCTICRITEKGREAFAEYVDTLKQYLAL
ncbi:MAG: transcriptional regulator [Bacteroidales bacterium]|nr:transcriptional regulator [Bacteroidales bacterium]